MRRKIAPMPDFQHKCRFTDETLVSTVTLSEACHMWQKSETAMMFALMSGKIKGRRSFTGGEWLLSRVSLVKRYGQPVEDTVCQLLK